DASPVINIKNRAEAGGRERKLSEAELVEVWRAADVVGGDYGRIVKLLVLTGQRREEIGRLAWAEIHSNGTTRIELPPQGTKNPPEHIVLLSAEAIAALPPKPNVPDRTLVFGRLGTGFSGWSKSKVEIDQAIAAARRGRGIKTTMTPWRLHDL